MAISASSRSCGVDVYDARPAVPVISSGTSVGVCESGAATAVGTSVGVCESGANGGTCVDAIGVGAAGGAPLDQDAMSVVDWRGGDAARDGDGEDPSHRAGGEVASVVNSSVNNSQCLLLGNSSARRTVAHHCAHQWATHTAVASR